MTKRGRLQAAVENSAWLFVDRFIRLFLQIGVGVFVVRYLGPTQYGQLAYGIAFLSFFQSVANFGLDAIIIRDIARNPDSTGEVIGTAFGFRLIMAVLCWLSAIILVSLLHHSDRLTLRLIGLLGFVMVIQALDVIDLWFQSQSQSKRTVFVKLIAYSLTATLKMYLISVHANIMMFAIAFVTDFLFVGLCLLISYQGLRSPIKWTYSKHRAKRMISDCWPLMVGSLSTIVYMRIDQILLRMLAGPKELGLYSAFIPITEMWYTIPVIISVSVAPRLAEIRQCDEDLYYHYLQMAFKFAFAVGICIAIIVALFSKQIIVMLFGQSFLPAHTALRIHIFSLIFVFSGIFQGLWIINENRTILSLYKTLAGVSVAICLNLLLIPLYGAVGASITQVASQAVSCVFSNICLAPRIFKMQVMSAIPNVSCSKV